MVFEGKRQITHRCLKREAATGVSGQWERGLRWLVNKGLRAQVISSSYNSILGHENDPLRPQNAYFWDDIL